MTIEDKGRWLFGVNAIINWVISIRGIVRSRWNGSRIWRHSTELPLHAAIVDRFCVHVRLHVLGSKPASRGETFAGKVQLDRENDHGERSHDRLPLRTGAAAANASDCADELALDS